MNRLLMMGRKRLVPGASAIYLFNEGAGTTLTDYSGNGYHGTLGADAAAPTWTATGLTFDGGDYVNLGAVHRLFCDAGLAFTVSAVVTRTSDAGGNVIGRAGSTVGNRTFNIWYNTSGVPTFYLRGASNSAGLPALDTNPHLLTITWDGAAAAFTLDTGSPVALTVGAAAEETGESVFIGARTTANPTAFWYGGVHALTIHPFALTSGQISRNYDYLQALLAPRGVTLA